MKRIEGTRVVLAAAVLVTSLTACSGVGPFEPDGSNGDASLTPSNPVLGAIGATRQLQFTLGDGVDVTPSAVEWTSTAPSVATVSGTGMVTAVGDGTTAIVGDFNGARATTTVTVDATIVTTFQVAAAGQSDSAPGNNSATASITVSAN